MKSPLFVPSVSRHVSSNFWNAFLLTVSTTSLKPTTCSSHSKPAFIRTELCRSDYLNSPSNQRWYPTTPDETPRIDTSSFQQSIRYGLERETTAPHARHWHSFSVHLLDLILLQWAQVRVQLFIVFSSSWRFTQGLIQGSVIVLLLFLFYIASSLKDDAVISLFADDISIPTTARKKEDAEAAAQSGVTPPWPEARNGNQIWVLTKVRYAPSLLGLTTALGIQLSLLVLRKFASTRLLVFSASFWTEA